MDGSINISFNGLSGRNHESANLYFREDQEQDYLQRRARISAVLVGAKDYFSSRVPITDWVPPSSTPPRALQRPTFPPSPTCHSQRSATRSTPEWPPRTSPRSAPLRSGAGRR